MYSNRDTGLSFHYALGTALAASLLAGCAGANPFAKVHSGSAVAAQADYSDDKAIAKIEKAVAMAPHEASLRVELASAYLTAGRFASAVTTFEDAVALGDKSPRTALSLALAYIGTGRNSDATALLEQWRASIPASDFGLAIALAGDTGRGVAILADELRGSAADAKLRQNLAYAYALDGRWREARVLAAQDLPADQLDDRISGWAMQGRPEDYNKRVAGLLGAPVRADSGQPQFLALSSPAAETAPALAAVSLPEPARAVDPDRELPAVEEGESFWGTEPGDPAPLLPQTESQAAAPRDPLPAVPRPAQDMQVAARSETAPAAGDFAGAFAGDKPSITYVSRPVVQPIAARGRPVAAIAPSASFNGSTYLVQLGAFSSADNAEQAWKIYQRRYPGLKQENLRITEALVRGRKYWRVAVSGYDNRSANAMCSNVRGRGHGCIAYAESRPLPGSLPQPAGSGPMRARRR